MESSQDPNYKEVDLYTIPSYSSWFSWHDIHQVERYTLKEFFDGTSITRTPKIYKEYRDFIISKYREDPSRRLTFTEVRKSLVGDLNLLYKVFLFLETWSLINFTAPKDGEGDGAGEEDKWIVRVEEGAPHGVKVVANPNSLKPIAAPPVLSDDKVENGFKLPPLASYSDMYDELMRQSKVICGNCKEGCDSGGHYECIKEKGVIICQKCFKNESYGDNKSAEDFKFNDCAPCNGNLVSAWTDAETLLLLESVLKHGDDWDLVAQNVQTKSKLECISKLMQMPFGELMLGSASGKSKVLETNDNVNSVKRGKIDSTESQGNLITGDQLHEMKHDSQQYGDVEDLGPPTKRLCPAPVADASSSLMKQVARISMMVGSDVTASASEAAVAALCYENLCPREIFEVNENGYHEFGYYDTEKGSASQGDDSDREERHTSGDQRTSSTKSSIPLTLQMRAATATALGAAAARAKLLADQEDREIENLVATIIEMQVKKLKLKTRYVEDLELIMEKEYALMEEVEEFLVSERMKALHKMFSSGISRRRDHTAVLSQPVVFL